MTGQLLRAPRGDVHVLPIRDLREHEETRECWCEPRLLDRHRRSWLVVHNSLDGRELVERHGVQ